MKEAVLALSLLLIVAPLRCFTTDLSSLLPGMNEIQIEQDAQSRRLIVTTPNSFDRNSAYPVLFCFHGAGGKADGPSNRFTPFLEERGLILISAEAIRPLAKWNFKQDFHSVNYDDVGFISQVVEKLVAQQIADPQRIYAAGHSSGGLFCYRLAKETDIFAAVAPMSCGMAKDAHEPGEMTKPISILQVIGDNDKSYHGSTNPKITMYSAAERIEIWRTFNQCGPDPVIEKQGDEIVWHNYSSPNGIEVVFGKVMGQEHHIRRDLRDATDVVAIDFLFRHQIR
jgi:poly(3-hydroxybutyrate) depolymerase